MPAPKKNDSTNETRRAKTEARFEARAVSRGYAVGQAVCLYGRRRQFYRYRLADGEIEREFERYRRAVGLAARQLEKIGSSPGNPARQAKNDIFAAQLLMLEDRVLHSRVEKLIERERVNAEWAVESVTEDYIARFKSAADEHLRERYIDLEDVADRLLTALGGAAAIIKLEKNSIIVAKEVKPSTLIELAASQPQAVVTENGGWTSHTFILAREMNLPAVTGARRILRHVGDGDALIVDGFAGQVILNPAAATVKDYRRAAEKFRRRENAPVTTSGAATRTLDGREIVIRANLDLPNVYPEACSYGAQGVGLYRSEFLFNQYKGFPSEQEQIKAYAEIARAVGADAVRIRTFDLSAEQIGDDASEKEKNPALGLRAIRLAFRRPVEFRTQLRAVLRAAAVGGDVSIVLPMISDAAQIAQSKAILEEEREDLRRRRVAFGDVRLGAMIEVPAAILTIDEIARETDFLCLGTNDLVQYLLAVDRDNEAVADWFQTLHPAVLRAVKTVFRAAEKRAIPVAVCGEMAGSPVYIPVLLGLGARELSMNLNSLPRVRKIVAGVALEETVELAEILETCRTTEAVEAAVTEFYGGKWSHLFPKELFPPKNQIKL